MFEITDPDYTSDRVSKSDLYLKVPARAVLLALLALNVYFLPSIHGMFPVPAPGILVYLQEISFANEQRSIDAPVMPVLPEIVAIAGVTLLWTKLARGAFFRAA